MHNRTSVRFAESDILGMQFCLTSAGRVCKSALVLDDLIRTRDVADLAGRTVATVNRWVLEGKLIPAVEMPGRTGARLFRRADVDAFLTAEPVEEAS